MLSTSAQCNQHSIQVHSAQAHTKNATDGKQNILAKRAPPVHAQSIGTNHFLILPSSDLYNNYNVVEHREASMCSFSYVLTSMTGS